MSTTLLRLGPFLANKPTINNAGRIFTSTPHCLSSPSPSPPPLPRQLQQHYRHHRPFSHSAARMSASVGKYEYLVTIPDHANALQDRLAARATHLSNVQPSVVAGKVLMGGALLAQQPKGEEGETPQMIGSVMLVKADSEDEVRAILRADPYTKAGVWDVAKAEIRPFRCAIRTAM
ncbi:hypothetical protein DV736_g4705, partial [Chaetothyriales sp. CBS 134916]